MNEVEEYQIESQFVRRGWSFLSWRTVYEINSICKTCRTNVRHDVLLGRLLLRDSARTNTVYLTRTGTHLLYHWSTSATTEPNRANSSSVMCVTSPALSVVPGYKRNACQRFKRTRQKRKTQLTNRQEIDCSHPRRDSRGGAFRSVHTRVPVEVRSLSTHAGAASYVPTKPE